MDRSSARTDWLIFIALGFFWGSSYLFIKIGVDHGLEPFTLIMFRLLIGFCLLAVVVAFAPRAPPPRPADVRPPRGHGRDQHRHPVLADHVRRAASPRSIRRWRR